MTDRHPYRLCEVCLAYDDHPRIVLGVTADGPLGLHTPGETAQVAALLQPKLPANAAEVEARLASLGDNNEAKEAAYLELIPNVEEYDATRAWHQFLHPQHFDAHFDCYLGLRPDLQPQLALDDTRKIMPSTHALAGVTKGLQGDKLRAHLVTEPASDGSQS